MKIIFKNQEQNVKPVFGDVSVNQFFVNDGSLYQKYTDDEAHQITTTGGALFSEQEPFGSDYEIDRILPEVEKIEF